MRKIKKNPQIDKILKEQLKDRHDLLMSLEDLDFEKVRAYCCKYNINIPKSQEVIIIGLHKARYHSIDIPLELREKSKKWLRDRGYSERLF